MSILLEGATIGLAAWKVRSQDQMASVIGVTSRGIFIRAERRVMFISFERWRSPLTITLHAPSDQLRSLTIGTAVRITPARLIFPAIEIDLLAAEVWQPGGPSSARPLIDQREALKQLASTVIAYKAPDGFGWSLPHLLDLPEKQALSAGDAALLARLIQLRESIHQQDFDQATTLIESLLGLGRGLTPSGDDVTIGVLLSLNRWRRDRDWRALNQRVIEAAYRTTTLLSANLIECAVDGQADERLMKVVDGIVIGTPSIDECVDCVLGWGNSSGMDALVGMAIAVSANN